MRTMRLEPPAGRGTCGYEPHRGRLYVEIAQNGTRLSVEIPLGEMASRCQLSGRTLDAARARWEAANLDEPRPAARAKERARDRKRKAAHSHGVRDLLREPFEPEEPTVLVTARLHAPAPGEVE